MRHSLLIGGVVSIGAIMAVACGGSDSSGGIADDAGSSGTSGTSGASGTSGTSGTSGSSGDPDGGDGGADTTLKAGEVSLIGVTADGQAVYTIKGTGTERNIEAVPVAGGAPATIGTVADDADIAIAANTVAFWTAIDTNAGVGKLSLWTKAGGAKANVATESIPGFIASSEDGSRIAIAFNSPADTTSLAVTTPGAPSVVANATTAIVPNVNVGSPACNADFGFVGKTFFSAHCVGPGNGATALTKASLFTVPDVANPTLVTLVDGAVAANSLKPTWSGDKTGAHLLVFTINTSQARVLTLGAGAPTVANIENNVASGFLSDDGAKVFYRTAGLAFRSAPATNNATPGTAPAGAVTLVADGGFPFTIGTSKDKAHVLFRKLAPVGAQGEAPRVDINMIDTVTAAQTGIPLVATATGFPAGFTATSSHAVYLTEVSAAGIGKLKVRPVAAAGVEREVAAVAGLPRALPTGSKVIFFDNPKPLGQGVTVDLKVFDAAGTGAPTALAAGIDLFYEVSGTKLVYVKPGAAAGAGLYAVDIP